MAEQTIDVRPVASSLGAEVFGADLSDNLTNQIYDEIHQAFVPMRDCSWGDWAFDTLGAFACVGLVYLLPKSDSKNKRIK